MKQLLFILNFLFTYHVFSLGYPAPNPTQIADPSVQYKLIEGELTAQSEQMDGERYYQYISTPMAKGDIIILILESKEFIVAMGISDTLGHKSLQTDNPFFFETTGSKLEIPFHSTTDGLYNFVFTSKEINKTGKFKVHVFYYTNQLNTITNESRFCEKLKYIANNSYTEFEFLKKPTKYGSIKEEYVTPTLELIAGMENQIAQNVTGDSYIIRFPVFASEESAIKSFEEWINTLENCLADHKKEVLHDKDPKDFYYSQVVFILEGEYEKDLNMSHRLTQKIKDKVTFQEFFKQATINPNAHLITGMICGYRIEDIQTPLTKQARYLDKLIDELAKGRKMEKILRES